MRATNKPILNLRRRETEAVCKERGIQPFIDPSNSNSAFRRNRVRQELIPLLKDIAERDVAEIIARQANIVRDDDDLLNEISSTIDVSDAKAVASAPPAIARRAIRQWLTQHGDAELHPPSSAAVERVLRVANGEAVACEIEGGLSVRRSAQRLVIET